MTTPQGSDQEEHRDPCKARFFKAAKSKDKLPEPLVELFEKSNRRDQTEIVNKVVRRNEHGGFVLNFESEFYREIHTRYEESKAKEKAIGKTLTVARAMAGGKAMLQLSYRP